MFSWQYSTKYLLKLTIFFFSMQIWDEGIREDNKSDDIQSRGIGVAARVANRAVAQSQIAADIFEKHNLLRLRQYMYSRAAQRGV